MKLKLSVFIGVVLCVVLVGVYGVLSRMFDSREGWRPNDVYSSLGGSSYSTVSYSSSHSGGLAVPAVSMRGGRSFSRRVAAPAFSYAPAYAPALSTRQWSTGSAQSPISYTASSATMKSFGGGGNVATSAFGGATGNVTSTSATAPVGVSASMPSTSVYTYANNSTSASSVELSSVMSGEIAIASSQAYVGIGNTTGPRGVRGRKNIGDENVEDSWLNWLVLMGVNLEDIEGVWDENTNTWNYNLDVYELMKLYDAFCNGWNPSMGKKPTWDEWLAWFMGSENNPYMWDDGDNQYGFSFVPIGDFTPLLVLVVFYVAFVASRRRQQVKVKHEK